MKVVYSCVVDRSPKFFRQAYNLVLTLRAVGVAAPDILVNLTPPAEIYRPEFERLGCTVRSTPFFGDGKYCNKVAQLRNVPDDIDFVVCCDTDLMFLKNIEPDLVGKSGKVLGKIVDFGNPPIERLHAVVALTPDLPAIPDDVTDVDQKPTLNGNFNGGLYIVPGEHVRAFSEKWEQYALHLYQNPDAQEALGEYSWHIDQISFCFALHKLGLAFEKLSIAFNFPLHFPVPAERSEKVEDIRVLHYHDAVDENYLPDSIKVKNPAFKAHIQECVENLRTLTFLDDLEDQKAKQKKSRFAFVMGFHRSGTSLLAAGCEAIGYSVGSGRLLSASYDNPKGYYENHRLVKLNEEIQRSLESEWDDVFFSFGDAADETAHKFAVPLIQFLRQEFLISHHPRYLLKDPRVMQTYGIWRHAIETLGHEKPDIIFVYRNPLECAKSQQSRYRKSFLTDRDPFHFFGKDLRETLLLWYVYNVRFLMTLRDERAIVISYADLTSAPQETLQRVANWANIDADETALTTFSEQFFDKTLRHHELSHEEVRKATLSIPFVYDLYLTLERMSSGQRITPAELRDIVVTHSEPYSELMQQSFLGRLMSVPLRSWIHMRARGAK